MADLKKQLEEAQEKLQHLQAKKDKVNKNVVFGTEVHRLTRYSW